jgi:hypothetical protein
MSTIVALLVLGLLAGFEWLSEPLFSLGVLAASIWQPAAWQFRVSTCVGVVSLFGVIAAQVGFRSDYVLLILLGAGPGAIAFVSLAAACSLTWRMLDPAFFRMEPR